MSDEWSELKKLNDEVLQNPPVVGVVRFYLHSIGTAFWMEVPMHVYMRFLANMQESPHEFDGLRICRAFLNKSNARKGEVLHVWRDEG